MIMKIKTKQLKKIKGHQQFRYLCVSITEKSQGPVCLPWRCCQSWLESKPPKFWVLGRGASHLLLYWSDNKGKVIISKEMV